MTADDLINEFPTVFDGQVRVMNGELFKINLRDDAKPFCISAPRSIPYTSRDKVKKELDSLLSQEIIEPVTCPTEWCAPIVISPKKKNSDDIRICVDFSVLNKYVKRELYTSPTPIDAIADISQQQAKYFTVIDALKGYHQCPLDQHSQLLTTFMTPFGRYKLLRAPFGICSISEHYNKALREFKHYRKIVDDIVIFDSNFDEHVTHVKQFLATCADKGISLHRDKFKFAGHEVTFARYRLSQDGYHIDKSLLKAISDRVFHAH